MSAYVWVSPANSRNKYYTSLANDPHAPAGYVLTNTSDGSWQGVDGVHDQNLQQYKGGQASGGYPVYDGPSGYKIDPAHPNGILS